MTLKIGERPPEFTLPGTGGQSIGLGALKGKKAVLYFYPKDDTTGCTKEALDFQSRKQEFEAAGTKVIGISADSLSSHDKFRKKHGLEFDLASDEAKNMLTAYGVWVEKSMYGRKYMGIERTTLLLDKEGKVAKIWPKVSVPGHVDEVLKAAQAL